MTLLSSRTTSEGSTAWHTALPSRQEQLLARKVPFQWVLPRRSCWSSWCRLTRPWHRRLCLRGCWSGAGKTPWQRESIPCAPCIHPVAKVSLQAPPDSLSAPLLHFGQLLTQTDPNVDFPPLSPLSRLPRWAPSAGHGGLFEAPLYPSLVSCALPQYFWPEEFAAHVGKGEGRKQRGSGAGGSVGPRGQCHLPGNQQWHHEGAATRGAGDTNPLLGWS